MNAEPLLVLSTMPAAEAASEMARTLVEERLAACVNLVPGMRSIYRWQGTISDDAEVLLLIKTTREQVEPLRVRLGELHPYEVPEFVVLRIEAISESYGRWLEESVKAD